MFKLPDIPQGWQWSITNQDGQEDVFEVSVFKDDVKHSDWFNTKKITLHSIEGDKPVDALIHELTWKVAQKAWRSHRLELNADRIESSQEYVRSLMRRFLVD